MLQMDTLNCPNYTSTEYWDSWAANWNGEIISSIDEDINGVVTAALSAHCPSGPESFSVDFGCGVGLYLPSLAATSANVFGLDISRKLLARARADCDKRGLANVRLKRADLGTCDVRKMNIENIAHFAVCANVLISPEPCTRRSIVANLSACLKPNGVALFVVPAARSARLIEKAHGVWLAERRRRRIKACKEDERPETTSAADAKKGIFRRDDVRTKHFREAEIKKLLLKYGLETVEVSRVEYSWYTEFSDPIDILEECFDEVPFDWLIVTRKVPKDVA
jgi:SAM-dependent methyltransferase